MGAVVQETTRWRQIRRELRLRRGEEPVVIRAKGRVVLVSPRDGQLRARFWNHIREARAAVSLAGGITNKEIDDAIAKARAHPRSR